ncbi:MAG: tyrosine-type recombinase/integrase [Dehalococcoidales bacterium]|nr:tyrosine-type recombinase/integrase [Dehalococcoidales bacterium]
MVTRTRTRTRNRKWQELEKNGTSLEKLVRHFESHNRSEGKSPRTVEWYERVLRFFQNYLEEQDHSTKLGDLTLETVREFVVYLQTREKWYGHPSPPPGGGHLSAISVNNYVRGIRAFFSWLHREGYTDENVLASLKPPRFPRTLVDVLTDDEVGVILSYLDSNTASGCRDTAMIVVFLDSGVRLSELANLKFQDAHLEEGYLKVMGKGAKERIVPIGNVAQKILQRYVFHFRPEPLQEDNVFLTLEGYPLSGNAIRLIAARLARKSGVRRLHVHLFRHTFATNYLINGGDVFSLQQILGHTTLEMVKRYVTLASAHVRIQHRRFSPMDRMSAGRLKALRGKPKPKQGNGSHRD